MHIGFFTFILVSAVMFTGCTTNRERVVKEEVSRVQVAPSEDISSRVEDTITRAQWPTEEQKRKLLDLKDITTIQVKDMDVRINKLQLVLVENLMEQRFSSRKMGLLRKELKKLYSEREDMLMGALDSAEKILGKSPGLATLDLDKNYPNQILNDF